MLSLGRIVVGKKLKNDVLELESCKLDMNTSREKVENFWS